MAIKESFLKLIEIHLGDIPKSKTPLSEIEFMQSELKGSISLGVIALEELAELKTKYLTMKMVEVMKDADKNKTKPV
jgi:hypothetical protein